MGKTALWIGRFQPYTLGHDDAIEQIEKHKDIEKILIGIGSAQEEFTAKNPFTYYERKKMVQTALEKKLEKPFEIYPIPDFGNNKKWTEYILENLPHFDIVYSGNPYVEVCFKDHNKEFRHLKINKPIKATQVRTEIARGNYTNIPDTIIDIMETIKAKERLKQIINTPICPYLAVDGIVEYKNGIILIERKNPPHGWALPGGFVDYGESCEKAIAREIKEEINLEFRGKQFRVYSNPDRDPRQHVVSIVYVGEGKGDLEAKDDARKVIIAKSEDLLKYNLAFDHKKIIKDYLTMKNANR